MAKKQRKPKKGKYRPVNQAGFRSIFAGSLGAKPRKKRASR